MKMKRSKSHFFCAFALLLLFVSTAYPSSPSLVVEHDWRVFNGRYAFGIWQTAPIVAPPNQFFPNEQVIMPRRIYVHVGTWRTHIEGYDAPCVIAALVGIAFVLALTVSVRIHNRPVTADSATEDAQRP